MKNFDLLEYIKERFSRYENYYNILGVKPNSATDENIKQAYDNKCMQLNKMLKDYNNEEIEEIRELIQTSLADAYTALKTENSRKHYNELLKTINTLSESREKKEDIEEEL